MLCLPEKEEVARMRRRVMLAVVTLMMALMMALSGPALAQGEPPAAPGNKLCAIAAVAIFIGLEREGPTPGERISTNCVPPA